LARFVEQGKEASMGVSFQEWVTCYISYYVENLPSIHFIIFKKTENSFEKKIYNGVCGEVPKIRPDLGVQQLQYIMFSMHGILLLLFFLFDKNLWAGWRRLGRTVLKKIRRKGVKPSPSVTLSSMISVEI
jgi:hypothetical protein